MAELHTSNTWTLFGLIEAFIDLAFAYFFLCVSTFAFFASKFCNFFGFYLPCPCTGFLGYHSTTICLHKVLIEYPMRKISSVQMSVTSKSPFDLISLRHHQPRSYDTASCRVTEYENEAGSSSFRTPRFLNSIEKERRYDTKGKKVVNQKQKSGIRRLRRSAIGNNGKPSKRLVAADASSSQISDNLDPVSSTEIFSQDDVIAAASGLDLNGRTWRSFEQIEPYSKYHTKENYSSSVGNFSYGVENEMTNGGNEENEIRLLKEALQEEKAACTSLYLELEKERAAAASAADEAMAMIMRLQEDKALIEMEARQYHRMIEEKFAYDEEEMKILKEILVRKEQEIHFLEKEVEEYKQMTSLGNGQTDVDLGEKPLHSLDWYEDTSPMLQGLEKRESIEQHDKDREILHDVGADQQNLKHDTEPIIYDVHVIDDKIEQQKQGSNKGSESSNLIPTNYGTEVDEEANTMLGDSQSEDLASTSYKNPSALANNERLKIDTEVELLRERLRMVQEGKEKLVVSADHRESINAQFKLVEEIVNQLQDIQQLKEPSRQASLPPLSSKVSLKKRRCRSASLETRETS